MINVDYLNLDNIDDGIVENPNGSVTFPALLTRTGIFKYQQVDSNGNVNIIRQLRTPEEIFAEDSMASLSGLPLTNNHPPGRVITPQNATDYIVGMTNGDPKRVSSVVQGDSEEYIQQRLTVVDGETLGQIRSKSKMQVSLGYSCELDFTPGIYKGAPYDCVQRRIRNNHISVVRQGRAGPTCKVLVDDGSERIVNCDGISVDEDLNPNNKEPEMKIFNFDGKEYQVEDDVHALLTAFKTKMSAGADLADSKQKELDKVQALCDSMKSQLKTQNDADDQAKFRKAVQARVALEAKGREHLGESVNLDSLSETEIMAKVIAKAHPAVNIDGKSEEYLRALFDLSVANPVHNTDEEDLGNTKSQNTDSSDDWTKVASAAKSKAWNRDAKLWEGDIK